jgi:hypothetical protein
LASTRSVIAAQDQVLPKLYEVPAPISRVSAVRVVILGNVKLPVAVVLPPTSIGVPEVTHPDTATMVTT